MVMKRPCHWYLLPNLTREKDHPSGSIFTSGLTKVTEDMGPFPKKTDFYKYVQELSLSLIAFERFNLHSIANGKKNKPGYFFK